MEKLNLITETNFNEIETLCEDLFAEDKTTVIGKTWYIVGRFIQCEIKNRNGRKYPLYIMEREVERYNKDWISQNRALGELGHPEGPTVNLDRASHQFLSLYKEGNDFIGKAKILTNQEHGKKVAGFLADGIKLGISTRGMGSLRNINGTDEVQSDYFLATAGDIVLDPSAPNAFVRGIYENKTWIREGNSWIECYVEEIKKNLDIKCNEEMILNSFNKYMELLKYGPVK